MLIVLAALAGPLLLPPPRLQAMVEGFAGVPALVDPRLLLPDCPAPVLGWAGTGSVEVRCTAPAWRVFVSVGARPAVLQPSEPPATAVRTAPPVIRRGDRVMLEAVGEGFTVGIETTAAADSRDDRVALRSPSGRSLTGTIGSDGRVRTSRLGAGRLSAAAGGR